VTTEKKNDKTSKISKTNNTSANLISQKYADLVSNDKKIKNLRNAIEKTEESIIHS